MILSLRLLYWYFRTSYIALFLLIITMISYQVFLFHSTPRNWMTRTTVMRLTSTDVIWKSSARREMFRLWSPMQLAAYITCNRCSTKLKVSSVEFWMNTLSWTVRSDRFTSQYWIINVGTEQFVTRETIIWRDAQFHLELDKLWIGNEVTVSESSPVRNLSKRSGFMMNRSQCMKKGFLFFLARFAVA